MWRMLWVSGKSVMVPVSVSGLGGGEGGHQLVEVQADGQPRPPGADLPVDILIKHVNDVWRESEMEA